MPIEISTLKFIENLTKKGGPEMQDYSRLDFIICELHTMALNGSLTSEDTLSLRTAMGPSLAVSTMQGLALAKPHGYAGDFEIIDRIYRCAICDDPELSRWDVYYHQHSAPKAVRNRKEYFHRLLDQYSRSRNRLEVLKIAIGPGRSMYEWIARNPSYPIVIDCVDLDPNALEYARNLNHEYLDRINLIQKNALRFNPTKSYDLIWIAGLFDYFDNKVFVRLLSRYLKALKINGELVLGNFSDRNPSRSYMELVGGWNLNHRSRSDLRTLAETAGASSADIFIGAEPEDVNLFLHVKRTEQEFDH